MRDYPLNHRPPASAARSRLIEMNIHTWAFLTRMLLPVLLITSLLAPPSLAQVVAEDDEPMIRLNFPPEMELRIFVEFVSQRLGINVLYDEQLANKRLTLRALRIGDFPAYAGGTAGDEPTAILFVTHASSSGRRRL